MNKDLNRQVEFPPLVRSIWIDDPITDGWNVSLFPSSKVNEGHFGGNF